MPAQLYVFAGPDKGRAFLLVAGETLQIGRSQATVTRLTDPTVSRVHCEVEYDGERAVIINISTSGTYVNNQPISQSELKPGDTIRIGATELRFLAGANEDTTAVPPPSPRPAVAANEPLTALVGQTMAHYAIESVIAKGTAGVVFRAKDTKDGQTVAFKVLQQEFTRSEDEMQRFVRAMKTMMPVHHPNLVTILGAGKTGQHCWIAMEYVEGESMTQVIRRLGVANMLDWKYGYRVAVHVARALEHAHGQSIIHRNVAPQNILLRTADKVVKLGDLMLAKALEGTMAQPITRPGELVGDVAYMSPERTRGTADVDERSDLYGLGATVYALIAGRPPFAGGSLPETINKIRTAEPEKPKKYQISIPDLFQGTVLKLLAKRPEERFQSATELLTDLERVGKFCGVSV
jgi:serine/threonine protein kinase